MFDILQTAFWHAISWTKIIYSDSNFIDVYFKGWINTPVHIESDISLHQADNKSLPGLMLTVSLGAFQATVSKVLLPVFYGW